MFFAIILIRIFIAFSFRRRYADTSVVYPMQSTAYAEQPTLLCIESAAHTGSLAFERRNETRNAWLAKGRLCSVPACTLP